MKRSRKTISRRVIRRHNRRMPPSGLELLVQSWLDEDQIEYRKQYPIGRCHVDLFFAPKTVVELNGCYFHAHECLRKERAWTPAEHKKRRQDLNRYRFLRKAGFDVVVLWECDVHEHPIKTRRLLRELAGKK